jgi:hypothetical protein
LPKSLSPEPSSCTALLWFGDDLDVSPGFMCRKHGSQCGSVELVEPLTGIWGRRLGCDCPQKRAMLVSWNG